MTASILGPSGSPMIELGGERSWLTRNIGEFVVSYQWIDIGAEEPEACMCIFRATRALDVVPYVIPQRNAWAFADSKSGQPTPHALGAAFKAALTMGTFPTQQTVHKLCDLIVEGMADLVKMPSSMPASLHVERAVRGIEAIATVNGTTILEQVL